MDIRRTVLWMIFSFSLLLLWNNWQIHNGKPSLFGGPRPRPPPPTASNRPPPATTPPLGAERARQCHAVRPDLGGARFGRCRPGRSEEVVVTTDVLRLTFDTMGAQLVRAELLKYPATGQADKPRCCWTAAPA